LRRALAAALAEQARSRDQRAQLSRLPGAVGLPLIPVPELCARELEKLADALAAAA
jgi:hypothetical protein